MDNRWINVLARPSEHSWRRGGRLIIDSHVHVWSEANDPRRGSVPWLPADIRQQYRDVSLDEVDAEMTEAGVTGVVLVQLVDNLRHTDELLAAAATSTRTAKVIGWLPLDDPGETTLALQRYADRAELSGVRHLLRPQDDPDWLLRPAVTQSLELVAEAELSLDVMPQHSGVLDQVPVIARRLPHLTIVIDLLGSPPIAERRMQPWTDQLAAAAAEPAVHVKVAGLDRVSGSHSDPDDWQPYVATAVTLFGPDRMMIGSNWPVVTVFGRSYRQALSTVLDSFAELIESERVDVQSGTASRVYRFA
jgi:L-fuconolactonase